MGGGSIEAVDEILIGHYHHHYNDNCYHNGIDNNNLLKLYHEQSGKILMTTNHSRRNTVSISNHSRQTDRYVLVMSEGNGGFVMIMHT